MAAGVSESRDSVVAFDFRGFMSASESPSPMFLVIFSESIVMLRSGLII